MPCRNVTVEAPPDESSLSVSINSINSPDFNTIEVQYTVTNTVTSGSGESVLRLVRTSVNGEVVDETMTSTSPGDTTTNSLIINDAPAGSNEVCVELD